MIRRVLRAVAHALLRLADRREPPSPQPARAAPAPDLVPAMTEARIAHWRSFLGRHSEAAARLAAAAAMDPKTYATEYVTLWNACHDRQPMPAPTFLSALHETDFRQ